MTIDWSHLYGKRKAVARKFGSIWQIPLGRRYIDVLLPLGNAGCRLLEIGAGNRSLQQKLHTHWGEFAYQSCDVDPSFGHEFATMADVEGTFDVICAFEMIEHVSLEEAHKIISRSFDCLVPGGVIAMTTPNIFYPPAFLRDATHITPFCYDELGGLLSLCGFEVSQIVRLHHDSLLKKWLKRFLFYPVFRVLGIDFSHQIMVVGTRPEG